MQDDDEDLISEEVSEEITADTDILEETADDSVSEE